MSDVIDALNCCDVCGENHDTENCPELGLCEVKTEIDDSTTRARLTLPSYLQVVDNGDGLIGVVAKEEIPPKTQLGPYEAKRTTHVFEDTGFFTLKLIAKDGSMVCLDTTDEMECNWLCLVRAATSLETQNLMAYQLGSNIFYNTTRLVEKGEELQVWYAPHFARKLGKLSAPDGDTKVLLGHRIEPLAPNGIGNDTSQTEDTGNLSSAQENMQTGEQDDWEDAAKEDNQKGPNTGKICPAFWCPRCGNTFPTQASMVLHLRQHVFSITTRTKRQAVYPKRGRGRPRKNPVFDSGAVVVSPTVGKRKRGRPKKSQSRVFEDMNEEYDLADESNDDDGENSNENDADIDDENEKLVDPMESAPKRLKLLNSSIEDVEDSDYTPNKVLSVSSGQRVQPSRQRKGRTSRYEDSYVTPVLKRLVKVEVNSTLDESVKDENLQMQVVTEMPSSDMPIKRKRGRPRKNAEVEKNQVVQTNEINSACISVSGENGVTEVSNLSDSNTKMIGMTTDNTSEGIVKQEKISDVLGTSVINPVAAMENQPNPEDKSQLMGENVVISALADAEETKGAETTESIRIQQVTDENELSELVENVKGVQTEYFDENYDQNEKDLIPENEEIDEKGQSGSKNDFNELYEIISEDMEDTENQEDVLKYRCKICMKMFTKMTYLKLHLPKHTGQYHCKKCEKKFARRENLQKHKCVRSKKDLMDIFKELINETQEGEVTLYACNKCDVTVCERDEAVEHCREHTGDLQCSNCLIEFESKEELHGHECDQQNRFPCDICKQAFKSAKYLYRHMAMHTDIFSCEKCNKCFSRKDSLQKHILKCCPQLAEKYNIYTCDMCAKVFSTRSGKKSHMAKCKLVKCSKCQRIFPSSQDLDEHECSDNEHIDQDSKMREFSCAKCGKSFLSLHYLSKHKLIHEGKHVCTHCNKIFATDDDCNYHMNICKHVRKIKHGGVGTCDKCGESFTNAKLLREHCMTHTHPFSCQDCGKRFVKIGTLKLHSCMESGIRYECQVCAKSFTCERFLSRHKRLHGEAKYFCEQCKQEFHRKDLLYDHTCKDEEGNAVRVMRTDGVMKVVEKYVCETCGKFFVNKSNLSKHRISHGEKQCECSECGKKFHYEAYLKEHISSVHMNIFKYQCSDCGKMMKSKTGLVSHVKQFHSNISETYNCPTCGKGFKQKGNMKTHMYSHEKGRPFQCSFCSKSFKYPDQLNRHKLQHTMINKLQCSQCEKKFCKPYELKKHMMVFHSGYVYVCGVCYARCGHRHTLIRHYKRKHSSHLHLINEEGYINSLLKHTSDLPEESNQLEDQFDTQHIIQLDSTQFNLLRSQNATNTIVLPGNTAILPQDAAEALHSLSSVAISSSQLTELKDANLLKTESGIVTGELMTDGQLILQNIDVPESSENSDPTPQKLIANQHTVPLDGSPINTERNELGVVANSNGTISINGQEVSIQDIPHTIESLEGGDNQIVILQIVEPESGDMVTGEAIQVQDFENGTIHVQDIQNLENLEVQTSIV